MVPPTWLNGISAKAVAPHIWEIEITGYGAADVGPYAEARKYADRLRIERLARARGQQLRSELPAYVDGAPLEAHHIVGREHLEFTSPLYSDSDAPAVIITAAMHRKLISPRITAEQNYLGGRPRDGRVFATAAEVRSLYKLVYTGHTPFIELFRVAHNILK
jgi:hypothetical protein